MYRSLILLAAGLVLLGAVCAQADDAVLAEMYGKGVHAYFSRDYVKAHEHLTSAVVAGSKDPRCYYFRGLAYVKLGRGTEAEMDFQKGAELESRDLNRFYNVARSLERIQGRARLALERHRAKARMAALKRAEQARQARYGAIRRQEDRVLQEQIEAARKPPADVPAETRVEPSGEVKPGRMFDAVGRALGKAVGGGADKEVDDRGPAAGPPEEPAVEPAAETPANPFEPAAEPAEETPENPFEPAAEPPAE